MGSALTGHTVQEAWPATLYVPAAHVMIDAAVAPGHALPALQGVQTIAFAAEYVPFAQAVGTLVVDGQANPAEQPVHELDPSTAYEPAEQGVGTTAGFPQEYPAGQSC